jgi:hypothetical protein
MIHCKSNQWPKDAFQKLMRIYTLIYNVLPLQDKLGAFIVRNKGARSSIQPGRVSMGLTFRRPSLGHVQTCTLDWVHGVEEDAIYEKNCKHQVRDYGDAGNGLKLIKLEPLDGDAGNGLKPVSVLGFPLANLSRWPL